MKTVKGILVLILSVTVLSGCWDRVEINDVAIVSAIGVDLVNDDELKLSLQVAIPSKLSTAQGGGASGGKGTFVISETGKTVSEAFRHIQMKMPRRIFFSQSRVLLIGEKLAKEGVANIVDFHTRYHEPRINTMIMFTKGEATEIIKSKPKFENVTAEETKELIKLDVGLSILIRDFENMLLVDGREPVAQEFVLSPIEVDSSKKGEKIQSLGGVAVFKGDKLIGWLDGPETRGLKWMRNEMETGVITIDIPEEKGSGRISTTINKAESKLVPTLKNGKVKMDIDVEVEIEVIENASNVSLDTESNLEFLNKSVEKEVKERIQIVVDKVQKELQSDVFGFGERVYKKYPKEWNKTFKENWEEIFPQVEVSINPTVYTRRIGLSTR